MALFHLYYLLVGTSQTSHIKTAELPKTLLLISERDSIGWKHTCNARRDEGPAETRQHVPAKTKGLARVLSARRWLT
jgi:hypothetical protein